MTIRNIAAALLVFILSCVTAQAQSVSDHVERTATPDWVRVVGTPSYDKSAEEGRGTVFPLIDSQKRYGTDDEEWYYHYVVDLMSSEGVEEHGTISVDFDPAFERLEIHQVNLIRDGQVRDASDFAEAMVFQTETDRSQMIFNGTMTFSLPILDVRVGDRLDVAYTLRGRNPAIGEGFLARRSFETGLEVKRLFYRVLTAPGMDIHTLSIHDAPEPAVLTENGWTVFKWDAPDPQSAPSEGNFPAWYYGAPTYEISNFETWDEVGNLFAGYYPVGPEQRAAVADIVTEIRQAHRGDKARARAALDWVQTNIRYVALSFGEGGFVPREPERVLRRRFGDCKDVTYLLLVLLDELGIEADPLLVETRERGGEFLGLPHPYAFNHIMVVADIDGQIYPMDATRNPQTGSLDTMEKGDITKGLRLVEGASQVIDLPSSGYEFRQIVREKFDLVSDPRDILYTMEFEEYGVDADVTLSWLESDGETDVQETFVRYLRDIFPTLEVASPMQVESDREAAMTKLRFEFRLPGYGMGGEQQLQTRAWQILAVMPSFDGSTRTAPYAIPHERSVRHIREYIGDENYAFETVTRTVETDAFTYQFRDIAGQGTLREDYTWRSQQDHMEPDSFEKDMSYVDQIMDMNYSGINVGNRSLKPGR